MLLGRCPCQSQSKRVTTREIEDSPRYRSGNVSLLKYQPSCRGIKFTQPKTDMQAFRRNPGSIWRPT